MNLSMINSLKICLLVCKTIFHKFEVSERKKKKNFLTKTQI